jgi:MFS family permease
LADRLSFKTIIIAGFILFAIVYGGFAFSPSIEVIIILFSVYGIFSAATEGVIKAWITNLSDHQNTATAIGFYTSCESICTLLASIIAGALWTNFGSASTFIVTSVVTITVCIYFILQKRDAK